MKIGITTFHWSNNYGAVWQAHALLSFLKQRGHAAQIIDYRPEAPAAGPRRWLARSPRGCIEKWGAEYKRYLFERFRARHLTRTQDVFRAPEDLSAVSDRFDALITGSDQVWNPKWLEQFDGLADVYFLRFAGSRTRRLSYAASFGHATTATIETAWRDRLGKLLRGLDAISVRESSGVTLVRELSQRVDAVDVADPVLLHRRSYYEQFCVINHSRPPYILAYMLHGVDATHHPAVQQAASMARLPVRVCDLRHGPWHPNHVLPDPKDWLCMIRDASSVVTNSFHAVVFCLLFHVPFLPVMMDGPFSGMNARLIELLKAVGLDSYSQAVVEGTHTEACDWILVDRRLEGLRKHAGIFLEQQGL